MRFRFVVLAVLIGCLAYLLGLGPARTQNPPAPPAAKERPAQPQQSPPQQSPTAAPKADASTDKVDERFKRLDRDGDGFLSLDEMTENLKAELDKWDVNRDGKIELREWRDYVAAFNAQRRRPARKLGKKPRTQAAGKTPRVGSGSRPPFDDDRLAKRMGLGLAQRSKGTSSANYPANLPAWFSEYDTDGDGQVSLYEWMEREENVEEFWKYDLNEDGFITIEELIVSGQYTTDKGQLPPLRLNIFQAQPGVFFYIEIIGTTNEEIFGTDVYPFNSSLATAAVHAGALRAGEKGLVKVTIMPGQSQYRGSTFNGVTSKSFGAFQKSYRVQRAP